MAGPLAGKVALVAGATRGAGRGIAVELGAAGATVYVTGRSTRESKSPMNRAETIEETAERVTARGGVGIAARVDHTRPEEVAALIERIKKEQGGQLDLLVNDIWGGDPLTEWVPFWKHRLDNGLLMQQQAVFSHIITSWHAAPLMVERRKGLIIEITDGANYAFYRGALFYDLAKVSAIRLARAQAEDLRPHQVAAVALCPGFLRSEAVLDHLGVTENTWRDGIAKDPHFAASETPAYIGRAVVALATEPNIMARSGRVFSTWGLAKEYGFTDVDGTRPDWGGYAREKLSIELDRDS